MMKTVFLFREGWVWGCVQVLKSAVGFLQVDSPTLRSIALSAGILKYLSRE